jgi:predicted RNA methylase
MESIKKYWPMTEGSFNCLIDETRTERFGKVIKKMIKKGDIVVDAGAGTGILSLFAAEAGASKIYSVELDENNIRTLQNNFKINGYKDKIIFIKGDVTKIKLPQKVNAVICEMIATGLIDELQIPAMNNILKYTNNRVKILIKGFESYVDLVYNPDEFYRHKLKIIRYEYSDVPRTKSTVFSKKNLYNKTDLTKVNKENKIAKKIPLKINQNGIINAMRISSKTILYDNSKFSDSFAYSFPIILPIKDVKVKKGDNFLISLFYTMCKGLKNLKYEVIKIS